MCACGVCKGSASVHGGQIYTMPNSQPFWCTYQSLYPTCWISTKVEPKWWEVGMGGGGGGLHQMCDNPHLWPYKFDIILYMINSGQYYNIIG